MEEANAIHARIRDMRGRLEALRGIFDIESGREKLEEVNRELESPDVWSEPARAQALGRARARLVEIVETFDRLGGGLDDAETLLDLAEEESDAATVAEVDADVAALDERLGVLEFRRMFSGEMDPSNAFLDIQAGSGGTEAQDWAEMLLRMYLRWGSVGGSRPS